jgi:protein pelota
MIHEAPESVAGRGSHHTFSVSVNKSITIVKEKWSKLHIDRLYRATRSEVPPVIVVSIDSEEFCVAILRQYGIDIRVEGRTKLPSKLEANKRTNALQKYFKTVLKALDNIWRSNRVSIVIIGVGFVKNQFMKFIDNEATDLAKSVIGVKSVNAGGLAGIREALRSGILDKALKHLRISEESLIVEELLGRLAREKGDVTYGLEQVRNADSFGAVETILITDFTIRDASDNTRLVLEELMRDVEKKGGKIIVISIEHEAGEKLHALGGIAALLRYPVSPIKNSIDHET